MIINQKNKDMLLNGQMKRGFNQTPAELKEKLANQNIQIKKETIDNDKITEEYYKLKKIRNDLKRF